MTTITANLDLLLIRMTASDAATAITQAVATHLQKYIDRAWEYGPQMLLILMKTT